MIIRNLRSHLQPEQQISYMIFSFNDVLLLTLLVQHKIEYFSSHRPPNPLNIQHKTDYALLDEPERERVLLSKKGRIDFNRHNI